LSTIWVNTVPTPVDYYVPSYHPDANVYPSSWLQTDLLGTPQGCPLDQFTDPNDNEFYHRITDGTVTGATPAQKWDMERNLYRTLNSYPSLVSMYSGYPTFLSNQQTATNGKFWAIENKIKEGLSSTPTVLDQVVQSNSGIDDLTNQLIANDNLIDISTGSALEAAYQNKILLEKQLTAASSLAGDMQVAYIASTTAKFTEALNLNTAITASQVYEQNEKTVNDIWLKSNLFQNGDFTDAQVAALIQIAGQCPADGGQAVYRARGMLTMEQQVKYNDFTLGCRVDDRSDEPTERVTHNLKTFQIVPNPANDQITIKLPVGESARLRIYSMSGRLVLDTECSDEQVIIPIANLSQGLYVCQIIVDKAIVAVQKLSVER
jgi:hypothetical protein